MSSLTESFNKLRSSLQSIGKKGGGDGESASSSGGKFDPKAALAWVKSHPAIVASLALMVIAPVASWWFSSGIHEAADAAASARAQKHGALEKYEKSTVDISLPGKAPEQLTGVVNQATVDQYRQLADRLQNDAKEIQRAALERNQRDRRSLIADVKVTPENSNTIADRVYGAVVAQAEKDLKRVRAGMPPSDEGLLDQLQRAQDQFIATERKPDRKSLNAEQIELLRKKLVEKRLQLYTDAASGISFYADIADIGLPGSSEEAGTPPSEARMFHWQWRLWIIEDVLDALAAANAKSKSVSDAPVKRLIALSVRDEVAPKAASPGGEAAAAPTEGAPAEGAPPAAAEAAAFPPIDLKTPVTYDFAKTITGRVSNSLYDVRLATLRVVVATERIPEVLDAIARQNLMTVVNLDVRPADAFEAADEGFIFGPRPVSELRLTIESLWMRPWIARLMPAELQKQKGTDGRTTDDPPPTPAGEPST